MDWFLRFLLGVPADSEGRKRAAALLADLDATGEQGGDWLFPFPFPLMLDEPGPWYVSRGRLRSALHDWLGREGRPQPATESEVLTVGAPGTCPLKEQCPLRNGNAQPRSDASIKSSTEANTAGEQKATRDDSEARHQPTGDVIVELLRIGGGGVGIGAKAFLDLLDKTAHCRGEDVSAIVITDRYFHSSLGEDGSGSGYKTLLDVFDVLGVRASQHPLTLRVCPSPAKASTEKIAAFRARLMKERKGLSVDVHAQVSVHDRFYLVQSSKRVKGKNLSGVFGPSLNGVDAGLYLMGSLEDDPLKVLANALGL